MRRTDWLLVTPLAGALLFPAVARANDECMISSASYPTACQAHREVRSLHEGGLEDGLARAVVAGAGDTRAGGLALPRVVSVSVLDEESCNGH